VIRIEKILVPVDFSPHSGRAQELAGDLARTFGAEIHLLHCYELPVRAMMPYDLAVPEEIWTAVRDAAGRKLDKARDKVRGEGLPVESHLSGSPPFQAITAVAEDIGADLIVMGTRGLTGLKHVLLGSVAERTLRTAPCPVLTVKDDSAA
jgi:nucleotide-binding universal stress UspA family protein